MKKVTLFVLFLLCVCLSLTACGDAADVSSAPGVSETSDAASSIAGTEESAEESSEPTVREARTFWLTHYNDGAAEGAGSIFPAPDTAGVWAAHVAFKPVSEDVYEIVEISDGVAGAGNGVKLKVPEGGFVWAVNKGNDWPSLIENAVGNEWFCDDVHKAMPDYTSVACDTMIIDVRSWRGGDRIRFSGIDPKGQTVPTDTPELGWYEPDYVCTATWEFAN